MKKQIQTLKLKKQTISSLRAQLAQGGATTTMTVNTFAAGCQSQLICDPVPSDPRPDSGISRCKPCGSWNRPGCK
ncbi:MAG: hypothetical protein AAF617_14685 [Bacteroidota bacterium]